ncbi:ABC transporter ATP-binding protein [Methanosarcina acetivorans]|uniref:Nickel import system ATP-binding protein NikD n=1 Tax=Methanosarcina acetivorans (strain ATCC 35395 / DSM 2834 / JCM 12185 / C2A) TaxID=188937 RepID=Q8TN14_METAC|nr:ABC transporter ATP-binding protein [Methanosarcina acetivorans]AAM05865.1 peptide ABC transporter, ATP-binding protein [Methanosarcina acetivorans C2A]
MSLLKVRDLSVTFDTLQGPFKAIEGIDLDVEEFDTLAIVGESGCGKSVLGHATMRLLDDIAVVKGSVIYRGREVYAMSREELLELRGKAISLVPQSPSASFNPVIRIGTQITELIEKAGVAHGREAEQRALTYLERVGFPDPRAIFNSYPHRMSGGMCERALIAMSTSTEPDLIIADEPTKGLDALSRKNILYMLQKMTTGSTLIMITHDFKAAAMCKRIAVMYSGEIVEIGPTRVVLEQPTHHYTRGLIDAQPSRGMKPIPGRHTIGSHTSEGCRFRDRCDRVRSECGRHPLLRKIEDYRMVRCHYA